MFHIQYSFYYMSFWETMSEITVIHALILIPDKYENPFMHAGAVAPPPYYSESMLLTASEQFSYSFSQANIWRNFE